MADEYKVNTVVGVAYQALKADVGLTIDMDVYDEAQALDVAKSLSGISEVGSGRYYGEFTPDAEGNWIVMLYERGETGSKAGNVVKLFKIIGHDTDSIGDTVDALSGDISAVDTKVDGISGDVSTLDGKADGISGDVGTLGTKIDGLSGDFGTMDGKIDGLSGDIGALGSPAMVS